MKNHLGEILFCGALLGALPTTYAQLSPPLVLPGDSALAPPAGDQTRVAFARGASATLMVWEDSRAALAGTQGAQGYSVATQITDVYAARIDDAGQTIDPLPIRISALAFSQVTPRVAWNGQNWLVVWASRTPGQTFSTQGVYGARISPAGQLLDDPPITISDTSSYDEYEPVVASDGDRWAVVWKAGIAAGTDAVRGCLVDAGGAIDAPRTLFQTVGGVGYYIPWNFELAWAAGSYLLVSEHMRPGRSDADILGQLFDGTLAKIGGEFPISTNTWNQNRAAIASNGAGFFVTWYDEQMWGEVRGSPVSTAGVVAVPDGAVFESGMYGSYPSPAAGWDGMQWIAAWDGTGPLRVARVSSAGALLPGSPFDVNAGTWSMQLPAVATLNGAALVGWSDLRNAASATGIDSLDLYGAIVDQAGGVAPDRSLLLSPPAQTRPDLAGSAASGYLVTFLSETGGTAAVLAQRVDAGGAPIDLQPIVVASGARRIRKPSVAFDGTRWLVVWEESPASSGPASVYAQRVGTNGALLDGAPIVVMPGTSPDVAAVGGVFLVVSTTTPNHQQSIHGKRLRGADGALLDATPLYIGSLYSVDPAVTGFADRWLVAWQQHPSHDNASASIWTSFVFADGSTAGGVMAGSGGKAPSVVSAGSLALLSWSVASDVRARRIQADGTLLDSSTGFAVSDAFNAQFAPESGFDGTSFVVAWNDYRAHANLLDGGLGDLFGARVLPDGTVSDPAGVAIAADFTVPEGSPAVAGDLGTTILAYTMMRVEAPYGTLRITLRAMGASGAIQAYCSGEGNPILCPCGNHTVGGAGCMNSTGLGALLGAAGTTSVGSDDLLLSTSQLPPFQFGMTYMGPNPIHVPFGDGIRCVGGGIARFGPPQSSGAGGSMTLGPGIVSQAASQFSPVHWIHAGQTWRFQSWYRDPLGPCGSGLDFSNALAVTFTP